jgi:hypothetical protein
MEDLQRALRRLSDAELLTCAGWPWIQLTNVKSKPGARLLLCGCAIALTPNTGCAQTQPVGIDIEIASDFDPA